MSRLPQVNGDKGNWGRILNTWLKHIAGFRGVAPARPASGNLPAGVAINGNGYDTNDQFQSENSGLNFHHDFPANAPTGFTFIHTVHNRIYRREGNDWAVLLEGYTPQSGEHLWRRVSTGSPNIRNVPIDGFVGVNTDPDFRLHVLENRNDTIALFEGGSNNDIAEVKIFNSNVRSRSRPGGGVIVGGDALLTFETTNDAVWSVGITADYNNDNQRDNFFVISVNNRFGPHSPNDPSDDYLIITPNNGAVGIGNNYVPNTNLPASAILPNNGFYKLDVQGNTNVWELTTTQNFRMWGQNPQPNSLLTSTDTQGNAAWRDFVTLGLVTNAENIPANLDGTNSGWPFAQKVGTVLQFRKIVGETLNHGTQNNDTLFRVRTDGDLIRVGLTGGNNGDIIWRNRNTGVYQWTHPSSIRDLLGLGILTVGILDASSRVLQVNPNTFRPANNAAQNINIGFTGGSNGQLLTFNNDTYQWASAQALNLVTDGENIPQSAVSDPNNNGLSYFGKNGTILRFRAIRGENLIRARTENPGDPNTTLIRIGLTGGNNGEIIWRNQNNGVYEWTNPSNIRNLLGLGTLTVGILTTSSGVLQVTNPNTFNPANNAAQNINIGFTGGSNGQFLTVNNGTYQWANIPNMRDEDWLVAQNNPTGNPGTVPNNIDQWIYTNGNVGIGTASPQSRLSIGTSGDSSFAVYVNTGSNFGVYGAGSDIGVYGAGSDIGVYGSGGNFGVYGRNNSVAVYGFGNTGVYGRGNSTGVYGFGNTYDFYAGNIYGRSYFAGNVGIGTATPTNALHVFRLGFNPSQNDAAAIRVEGNWGGGIVFSEGNNRCAIYSPAGSDLVFATGGSSGGIPGRVHIDSIGRVGVNASPHLDKTLIVFTPSSHIDNSPLLNWGSSENAYLWTIGQLIERRGAVNDSQSRANNSSSISAFRQDALYVVNAYSTSAKTFMNGVVTAVTAGPDPTNHNARNNLLGLCETHMCMQTGPMHPQGNWGSLMIDNPRNPTNSFVGFGCRYDLSQVPNNCRPYFINCFSSDNQGPNWNDAGHFLVHARGHMRLFSPAGAVAYKNGSSTWDAISDARLKTNIRPITGALEKIGQLRGVSFDWINQDLHKGDSTSGFLAQEMEKVFPDCVNEVDSPAGDNADSKLTGGKIKTVGLTTGFFATIVEAIKEQQQIIEGLQKTVAQQQQLIDLQNQKIAQLEQKLEELANKLGS